MKIVYRNGSDNDSAALSRREDLEDLTEESILDNPVLKNKLTNTMPDPLQETLKI
jgi:hypothetical protein